MEENRRGRDYELLRGSGPRWGGTQSTGGSAASPALPGTFGVGGNAAGDQAGGGGGGWFGGGGGLIGGGGGGGSGHGPRAPCSRPGFAAVTDSSPSTTVLTIADVIDSVEALDLPRGLERPAQALQCAARTSTPTSSTAPAARAGRLHQPCQGAERQEDRRRRCRRSDHRGRGGARVARLRYGAEQPSNRRHARVGRGAAPAASAPASSPPPSRARARRRARRASGSPGSAG